MNEKQSNPAFSVDEYKGISTRMYLAAKAMQGGMQTFLNENYSTENYIKDCYTLADEIIKQENE